MAQKPFKQTEVKEYEIEPNGSFVVENYEWYFYSKTSCKWPAGVWAPKIGQMLNVNITNCTEKRAYYS
ncbi:Sarcosine oxidase beta subunit [Bacillus thuringiensis serovar israelensis ATCC 35646]|nr:Sarcosine oxidase beta subunit [Bacillus thuringiensis serovar israelensis ATCC 35646]